jgi:hypothetical protein
VDLLGQIKTQWWAVRRFMVVLFAVGTQNGYEWVVTLVLHRKIEFELPRALLAVQDHFIAQIWAKTELYFACFRIFSGILWVESGSGWYLLQPIRKSWEKSERIRGGSAAYSRNSPYRIQNAVICLYTSRAIARRLFHDTGWGGSQHMGGTRRTMARDGPSKEHRSIPYIGEAKISIN